MQTLIHNAILVLPDRVIEKGWLLIDGEQIAAIGDSAHHPVAVHQVIDACEGYLLPGLIDLHCDGIEKIVQPRPGVFIDMDVAFVEADIRLAGAGITTEFHALSFDDNEFGVRTETFAHKLIDMIHKTTDARVNHRVHARIEVTSERGCAILEDIIDDPAIGLVSIMDHSPGQGQYRTEQAFREYVMRIAHRTYEEVGEIIEHKSHQAQYIPSRIQHIAALARSRNLALATHDDDSAEKIAQWGALGVTLSEFPITIEAARAAREHGLIVSMGAPNVLRGMSSSGNLSATNAIQAGVVDSLCSDYYPASMLPAAFKLVREGIMSLPSAVCLVTLNPALALKMDDQVGSLTPGKAADIILVALNTAGAATVRQMWVDGQLRLSVH
jgi:alpha-D-ribose 1-methylphosphonate 5-triphosphate diphosphatase